MSFYIPETDTFNGLSFVHIPKTGGSSIKLSLKDLFWSTLVDLGHVKAGDPKLLKYYTFAVFRDPVNRAISFYNECYTIATTRPEMKEPLLAVTAGKDPVEEFNKGFDYFVENYFTCGLPHPSTPDIVVSPADSQLSFITIDNKIAVDLLLEFENLKKEWSLIEDYVGNKIELANENAGLLSAKEVKMSSETRKIIEHFYKEDLEFKETWRSNV